MPTNPVRRASARSPWTSGAFYLIVLIVATAAAAFAARVSPLWTAPFVLIAGLLGLTVVGALQLRQDDRLSQRHFLALMAMAFRRLPLLSNRRSTAASEAKRELD